MYLDHDRKEIVVVVHLTINSQLLTPLPQQLQVQLHEPLRHQVIQPLIQLRLLLNPILHQIQKLLLQQPIPLLLLLQVLRLNQPFHLKPTHLLQVALKLLPTHLLPTHYHILHNTQLLMLLQHPLVQPHLIEINKQQHHLPQHLHPLLILPQPNLIHSHTLYAIKVRLQLK